eukprot:TRINITY_DN7431_c0_g1_i1.p1 TRINITY_DN7431_c0_g1~~TRINITY_DN7431_c0_g1_i1.p1  ORF type:complete len:485 (-),score=120.01 TRINITY_DN7431_c0_g1_i1:41-1495(-)
MWLRGVAGRVVSGGRKGSVRKVAQRNVSGRTGRFRRELANSSASSRSCPSSSVSLVTFRTFRRTLHTSSRMEGGVSPLATKADEQFREAQQLIAQDLQEEAERLLEGAILLLRKAHSLPQTVATGETITDPVLANYSVNLAFTKQSLEKYEESDVLYKATLPTLRNLWASEPKQLGVTLMNHAEVQAMLRQFAEARKTCEEAVHHLKAAYGERNEIYATGLSNLSAYLCQLGLYKEAKPISREALRLMMDLLGRDNDYTKSCWSNYYIILTKLNMKDEIQDLETEWKAASETGGWLTGERPVPPEVMENLKKKLEERLTPPGPLDVGGFVKDPAFAKTELERFVEEAKKKGLSPEDPAFLDVLEHEVAAIMDGKHKSEEALEAATQRVSNMADKMGPEWRRFVDQILVVAPSLDDAANAINEAGGLDPEFVAQEKAALQAEAENEKKREETMARGAQARAEKADIIEEQKRMARAEIRGNQFDE